MDRRVYMENSREIPVYDSVDVLVLGGGVAGFGAAVAAARAGAKTLIVDSASSIGGMSTTGLMSHFTGSVNSRMYTEVLERMRGLRDCCSADAGDATIDPEALKRVYLDMLFESGANVLLYTMACQPIVEDGCVKGAIVENKNGRQAIMAKVIIDGTGDGDIAARAGVPYIVGREDDHAMQPATLMFKIAGVDTQRAVFPPSFETLVPTEKGELQAMAKQLLPYPAGHVLLYRTSLPGVVTVNMTNAIGIDGLDAASMTQAERICRSQMPKIVEFLREYAPGYEKCFIISSGAMMGIRETRHFEGEYTLTEQDILERRSFEDWIVREAQFNFDVHNITGGGLDKTGVQAKFPKDNHYEIPYRCCLPRKMEGLLLSGRMISGTHIAHSNYRAMPICLAIGEGCGYAAAQAAKKNISLREVDISCVQAQLLGEQDRWKEGSFHG